MSDKTLEKKSINFVDLISQLFQLLTDREKDVLKGRHSLSGADKKETLEKIGERYKITRERVRQIECDGIKKLKSAIGQGGHEAIKEIEEAMRVFLKKYGGVMQEDHLIDEIFKFYNDSVAQMVDDDIKMHRQSIAFLISQIIADKFEKVEAEDRYHPTWKLKETPWETVDSVLKILINILERENRPLDRNELLTLLKKEDFYSELQKSFPNQSSELPADLANLDDVILSYLKISRKLKENIFNEVGLADWKTVTPKRMNDKIYLILRQAGKPMHFIEIADKINEARFDHKKACPATIHNELILDKRYVLIGRGIYALKDWGYEGGTVAEVVEKILKKAGRPMDKKEITEEVSKQRIVKKATIQLALMNKNKFRKVDGRYELV